MKKIKKFSKYLICVILTFVLFLGCNSKALEGNWSVSSLIIDGVEQEIFNSNINFIFENNQIIAKGKSGVNLYNVYVTVNGESMKTHGMVNTGFMGSAEAMHYEDLFFDSFINCDSFKIKDDVLYVYNQEKKMELRLKRDVK